MSEPSRETSGRRIWSRRRRGDHPAGVIPHQSYQDPGPPGPGFFRRGGETVSRTAAVRRKKAWEHPEDVPTPRERRGPVDRWLRWVSGSAGRG